jgi:hypothetical protein
MKPAKKERATHNDEISPHLPPAFKLLKKFVEEHEARKKEIKQ